MADWPDELEALEKAATPAEWFVMRGTFGKVNDPRSATVYATGEDLIYVARCDGSQPMIHGAFDAIATAELIALLRNHAPRLIAIARAAEELVDRLDAVHADSHYQSVWQLYMIHGGDYTNGPKYEQELKRLRAALATPEGGDAR